VIHIASWRARAEEQDMRGELLINTYPDPVGLVLGIDPDSVVAERIPSISRHTDFDETPPESEAQESQPSGDSVAH
jgi:hypothetical protein